MFAMMRFMRAMLLLPKVWVAWVGLLMAVNMVGPLFFIQTLEAWAVLASFMAGAMILTAIHEKKGFVKLMGLGHILWIPLVIWLLTRLGLHESGSSIRNWLLAVIVVDILSLIIDTKDVLAYLRGDREPTLKLED